MRLSYFVHELTKMMGLILGSIKQSFPPLLKRVLLYIIMPVTWMQAPLSACAAAAIAPASFYYSFNNLKLIDQNNHAFQVASSMGKVTLYHFIFTHCSTVCPTQIKQLSEAQKSLSAETRKQVQFVSVSLDPLSDTPASLKRFANQYGADLSNWSFVTGDIKGIERLADSLMLYGSKQQVAQNTLKRPDGHSSYFWLMNRDGMLVQRYDGINADTKRIVREIESLASLKSR